MKRLLIAASLFALLVPSVAFAQQDRQAEEKVQVMTFKGTDVGGKVIGPSGEDFWHRVEGTKTGVYQTRQNFLPELLESPKEL